MVEATVDCLIILETRTWNHEMIEGIFAPQEADLIKKKKIYIYIYINIPLTKQAATDLMFWPMVEDGQYSFKSGYRFLKEEEAGLSLEAPPESAQHLWRKIWSLDVPNKVKHFIWRACKNSPPTKCNLVRLRVISDHHCDRCTTSTEHMLHAL